MSGENDDVKMTIKVPKKLRQRIKIEVAKRGIEIQDFAIEAFEDKLKGK